MLFGVILPENFNKPFLATNIQEYWQRWHISMSGFIGTYIYKSYVRATNKRKLGIFISFVFAGLWHKISIPFLIWGIGHGSLMAFSPKFNFDFITSKFLTLFATTVLNKSNHLSSIMEWYSFTTVSCPPSIN